MAVRDVVQAAAGVGGGGEYVEDVFSTYLYDGTGSNLEINNGIDLSGEGGLVWVKRRDGGDPHWLVDTERGLNKSLQSNSTNAENTGSQQIVSFDSDGFTLGNRNEGQNYNGLPFASWTFRKAPKFFDVVTYTGDGASSQNISHSLGSSVGSLIVKSVGSTGNWFVWHKDIGTDYLVLNSTGSRAGGIIWNYTAPTSTVFTVGDDLNINGATYVAYLFAHDAGGFGDDGEQNVISCGSYVGNASPTGPVVTLGYEPQWVLYKSVSAEENWYVVDNMRGVATGGATQLLLPSLNNAEITNASGTLDFQANGFQLRNGFGGNNEIGVTYIYIAIRRGPMKTPESGTEVFAPSIATQNYGAVVPSGFPVDMYLTATRTANPAGYGIEAKDRLRGKNFLATSKTDVEGDSGLFAFDRSDGVTPTRFSDSPITLMFRRAPGFFDVVCYTGNSTARTLTHNLTVAPELIILKSRSSTRNWVVYPNSPSQYLYLNAADQSNAADANSWNSTAPTSSVFSIGAGFQGNETGAAYVAYLFASLPGISKVSSYTGTGADLNVDCGFSAGARFVLIKRTDDTGDWYVWDSARGIVSGNDPYLLLNSAAAEVTNTDYIDPLSSGFTVTSSAPAALNASGGSYIFLAIA
jgi:hypothetical protein